MNKQIVLVIGGPGKSGSSTIAKMLEDHFHIRRICGGDLFRQEAKSRGYNSYEDYLTDVSMSEINKFDEYVDQKLRKFARMGNVIIESKPFAAIATIENIPCTAKIWLDANLNVRVKRALEKENISNSVRRLFRKISIKRDLKERYNIDRDRYKDLYGIEYDMPEKYNDLVIDNSNQTPKETFNLIIKYLEDAGFKN